MILPGRAGARRSHFLRPHALTPARERGKRRRFIMITRQIMENRPQFSKNSVRFMENRPAFSVNAVRFMVSQQPAPAQTAGRGGGGPSAIRSHGHGHPGMAVSRG